VLFRKGGILFCKITRLGLKPASFETCRALDMELFLSPELFRMIMDEMIRIATEREESGTKNYGICRRHSYI
jgi:hypothetical protein